MLDCRDRWHCTGLLDENSTSSLESLSFVDQWICIVAVGGFLQSIPHSKQDKRVDYHYRPTVHSVHGTFCEDHLGDSNKVACLDSMLVHG